MVNASQAALVSKLTIPIASVLCEAFFFGVYSALFVFATSVMWRRSSPSLRRNVMLTLLAVMYGISASHCAINVANSVRAISIGRFARSPVRQLMAFFLPTVNYVLSDGIVLWRAWVLWNRDFLLFIPAFIALICTFATSVAAAVYYYKGAVEHSARHIMTSHYFVWSTCGFSVSTNLWATGLIFIQTWQHRRSLRSLMGKATIATNTEKALAFLVESGALYLCIWIAYSAMNLTNLKGVLLFNTIMVQLVGIYPTTIVVVVTMRLSTADILSRPGATTTTDDSGVVFKPRSPSPQSSMPEDVEGSSSSERITISPNAISTRALVSGLPDK